MVMLIQYAQVGDPTAFSRAHAAWGRHYTWPQVTLWQSIRSVRWLLPFGILGQAIWAFDTLCAIGFLVLPFLLRRGFHKALPIHALLLTLMPLSTGITMSMGRCVIVAFPAFFALAKLGENRDVDRLIVFGSSLLLALFSVAFSNGYFLS